MKKLLGKLEGINNGLTRQSWRFFLYKKMERKDITKIPEIDRKLAEENIFGIARNFAPFVGLDFDKQILPALKDNSFWEVDYLNDSKWGLSLMDAYRCLLDVHRTIQIMGGISETVKVLKDQGKDNIVAIDAGTGTGVFAIYLAALGCKKVYALELNEQTAEIARKFVDSYGCSDVVEVVVGDATQIDIPELRENKADILVSENLSGGLFAEPQFQIINHLSKFLTIDAPVIPYSAELSVSVAKGDWDRIEWKDKQPRIALSARRVPNLSALTDRHEFYTVVSSSGMDVPKITTDTKIPAISNEAANTLLISTKFQINNLGKIYELEPDSAEFLGKTCALKLEGDVKPESGAYSVELSYEAGYATQKQGKGIRVEGSKIILKEE